MEKNPEISHKYRRDADTHIHLVEGADTVTTALLESPCLLTPEPNQSSNQDP